MAAKSSSRGGTVIALVAVHTNEGDNPAFETVDRRAENLARWMEGQPVSYHKVVDDDSVVLFVPDARMAWSLRSGNPRSLNVCMIGRARWSRGEWLRHDRMLRMTATIVREWCDRYDIPLRKITPEQVGKNQRGVIGHWDWTVGKRDGSHTDPGPGFPWDVLMAYAGGTDAAYPDTPYRRRENMIDNVAFSGTGSFGLIVPVGKASGITARAWVSATSRSGNGTVKVYAQSDKAGIADWEWSLTIKDGLSNRPYKELPDGTTQLVIQHNLPGAGVIGIETQAK